MNILILDKNSVPLTGKTPVSIGFSSGITGDLRIINLLEDKTIALDSQLNGIVTLKVKVTCLAASSRGKFILNFENFQYSS